MQELMARQQKIHIWINNIVIPIRATAQCMQLASKQQEGKGPIDLRQKKGA